MMFDGVKQRMVWRRGGEILVGSGLTLDTLFQALGESRSCYISNKMEELSNLRANGVDTREDEQAVWDTGFTFFQGKSSLIRRC